jgi:hypothetical protein
MATTTCFRLVILLSLAQYGWTQDDMNYRKRYNPVGTVKPPPFVMSRSNGSVGTLAVGAPVSLSASVFVFSANDVPVGAKGECMAELERAALFASKSIQIVVTTYYYDANKDTFVESYCVAEYVQGVRLCKPWDSAMRTKFYDGVAACVRHAVALGFTHTITFNPRLDMLPYGLWRVSAQFDPLGAIGGVSYFDVMLKPFATIAKMVATISPGTTVRLVLGGEMHFTLTYAPARYLQAVQLLRAEAGFGNFQVGVHTTPWELCPSMCSLVTTADLTAISQLFNAIDFIGVSVYPQIPENFGLSDLEKELLEMQAIFKAQIDIDLKTFSNRGALHILELGWGGGISDNGDIVATSAAEVANNPWRGIFGAYKVVTDPWKQYIADDAPVPTRSWLRKAYAAVLPWLRTGGGPSLGVGDAYIWSLASWDVIGIHWLSYDGAGNTYRDNVISNQIIGHNSGISGVQITTRFPYRRGMQCICFSCISSLWFLV